MLTSLGSFTNRERPSKAEGNVFLVPFSSLDSPERSVYEFDVSDSEYLPDSITRKRRHAVYYHRPPVWCPAHQTRSPSSVSGGSSSCCSGEMCSDCAADDSQMQDDAYSCIVDCCDTTAALASTVSGTETNTSQFDQDTVILVSSQCLQLYVAWIHAYWHSTTGRLMTGPKHGNSWARPRDMLYRIGESLRQNLVRVGCYCKALFIRMGWAPLRGYNPTRISD